MSLNPDIASGENVNELAGSASADEPAFIEAGVIRKPHGIKGEILVDIDEDLITFFKPGQIVYIGETHIKCSLRSIREHRSGFLILLNEFNNPEEIGNFRFSRLFLPDSGELHEKLIDNTILLDSQVIGLTVITNEGKELGQIVEIIETGANDVFVVDAGNKEILLPDIEDVIKKVDLKKRLMIVHLLPGLLLE